jgi:hypothetical protein
LASRRAQLLVAEELPIGHIRRLAAGFAEARTGRRPLENQKLKVSRSPSSVV